MVVQYLWLHVVAIITNRYLYAPFPATIIVEKYGSKDRFQCLLEVLTTGYKSANTVEADEWHFVLFLADVVSQT